MQRKKIVAATLLSAGLIFGTASSAFAVDSTRTSTATVATFNSQVAAYNTSLVAFDTATATFKIQAASYATAVQVHKTAYNNARATHKAILKANFPLITTPHYADLVAAYKSAMASYNSETVTFKAKVIAYQAALGAYKASYTSISMSFETVTKMREHLKTSISMAFTTSVHDANTALATAKASAKTIIQKSAAISAHRIAIVTAVATRKRAIDALNAKLVKPLELQIKSGANDNRFKTDRPVRPTH